MAPAADAGTTPARSQSVAERVDRVFRRLLAVTAVLALLITAVFVYVLGFLRPQQQRFDADAHALQLAHSGLINQETGLRGFILTRDPQFLQPYRQGVVSVATEDQVLTRDLASDPGVSPLLLAMREAQDEWESNWAARALDIGPRPDPASLQSFLDLGKSLFDDYRAAEARLDARLQSRRTSLTTQEGAALASGLVAILALGTVLVVTTMREGRRLRRELVAPVADIVAATASIASGDLETQITIGGPEEFRLIGAGINDMRDALNTARIHEREQQELMEGQAAQLRNLLSMSRQIGGSLNLKYVLRSISDFATAASGFALARVWLVDASNPNRLVSAFGDTGPAEDGPTGEVGVGTAGQAVRYGKPAAAGEGGGPTVELDADRPLVALAVPLVVGAKVIGAIELESDRPHRMAEGTLQVLETLATHAAASIEAARLHGETETLAQTDALTGLANRRRLDQDLNVECQRVARYGRPLALIMFDVDHFKRFNDTYGHSRGDEALQELARAVLEEVRNTDTAYRYGGEEFSILARETDHEQAMILAERLRRRIERHFLAQWSAAPVTASFGVGVVPPASPVPREMISEADRALYRAKAAGRNRVCGPERSSESAVTLGA